MSGHKRSLTNTGGRCRLSGDPASPRRLAHCLAVDPAAPVALHPWIPRVSGADASRDGAARDRHLPEGNIVDPFVGAGTTAVEAVRAADVHTALTFRRSR